TVAWRSLLPPFARLQPAHDSLIIVRGRDQRITDEMHVEERPRHPQPLQLAPHGHDAVAGRDQSRHPATTRTQGDQPIDLIDRRTEPPHDFLWRFVAFRGPCFIDAELDSSWRAPRRRDRGEA